MILRTAVGLAVIINVFFIAIILFDLGVPATVKRPEKRAADSARRLDEAPARPRRDLGPPQILDEPDWGFRLAFPGPPADKTRGSKALGVWECKVEDTVFDVQVTIRDWERTQDLKADRAFVDERVFSNLVHTHLRQEHSRRTFRLAGKYEAAEAVYSVLGVGGVRTMIRWWVVKAPYREYELHARGEDADFVGSAVTDRFFDSFTVRPVLPAVNR